MNNYDRAEKLGKMADLVKKLNEYRDSYYNDSESKVSDFVYDELYDELVALEKELGFAYANSPTQSVGYTVRTELNKVKHNHKMLSLDKTKSEKDVVSFLKEREAVVMAKMDGLTCSLKYENGSFKSAETRGDGLVGQDITHNVLRIDNVPKLIGLDGEVVIDGEIIVDYDTFHKINESLPEDEKFRHPRNYASGSILQLNSQVSAERKLKFVAWKLVSGVKENSFYKRLQILSDEGFTIVPCIIALKYFNEESVKKSVDLIKGFAEYNGYPIDGCVFGFDDIEYGESLGETAHHLRSQIAFKFYDDVHSTKLLNIEWSVGKSGVVTPTAVFEPVNIEGTIVQRASLHNLSNIRKLGLTKNCTVYVYRANQVIPQVEMCDDDGDGEIDVPKVCPACGEPLTIKNDGTSDFLYCSNKNCDGITLARFETYVGKKAANIDGLSEATIKVLFKEGYIKRFKDLYHLNDISAKLVEMNGFGEDSVNSLVRAIEDSRNITLERYITAMGIDGVGPSVAKALSKHFHYNYEEFKNALESGYNLAEIDGIGAVTNSSIYRWYLTDTLSSNLVSELNIAEMDFREGSGKLSGKKFCITGTFSKKRDELIELLAKEGGEFVSGISKKTDILFAGENAGSKLEKAKSLGIQVMNEEDLWNLLK